MPTPVINTTTSTQDHEQYETFEFALATVSNDEVDWTITGLPTGLTAEAVPTKYAATGVGATDIVTGTSSAFANGDRVYFSDLTGGTGLAALTPYYVRDVSGATFKLATSAGGSVINFTSDISAGSISKTRGSKVSGAITVAGIITTTFVAIGTAASAGVAVTFATAPVAGLLRSNPSIIIAVPQGTVSASGQTAEAGAPVLTLTGDQDALHYVQYEAAGTVIDLGTLARLEFGLKQRDTEELLILGGGAPTGADGTPLVKTGSGTTTTYIIAVTFGPAALETAWSENETDEGTSFIGQAQYRWEEPNPTSTPRVGPATMERRTLSFPVKLVRPVIT